MRRALAIAMICLLIRHFMHSYGKDDAFAAEHSASASADMAISLFGGGFTLEEIYEETEWILADALIGSLTRDYALIPELLGRVDILNMHDAGGSLFLPFRDEMTLPEVLEKNYFLAILLPLIAHRLIERMPARSESELRLYWDLGIKYSDPSFFPISSGKTLLMGFLHGAIVSESLPKPLLNHFLRDIGHMLEKEPHAIIYHSDPGAPGPQFDKSILSHLIQFEAISLLLSDENRAPEELQTKLESYFAGHRAVFELTAAGINDAGSFSMEIAFSQPQILVVKYVNGTIEMSHARFPPMQ